MKLKELIVGKFLSDDQKNFTAYNTDSKELGDMYDLMVEYSKLKQKDWFNRLLVEQRAITVDGKIRFDRETVMHDKENKKDVRVKVCFRYPVFSYIKSRWEKGTEYIKQKNFEALKSL